MPENSFGDYTRSVNPDVSLAMMREAQARGFTVIPSAQGDHWFPLDFIVQTLLGKEAGRAFDRELAQWRRANPGGFPERHPGAKGRYFRLFEFLEGYYEFKAQESGQR